MRLFLAAAALTAGALLATPSAAAAATGADCHRVHQQSGHNIGLLNGTQVYAPIDLGLDLSHNALGILGLAGVSDNDSGGDAVYCGNF